MLCPCNDTKRYSLIFLSFLFLFFSSSIFCLSRHDLPLNRIQSLPVFQKSKRSQCKRNPRSLKSHLKEGLVSNQWDETRSDQGRLGQAKKQRFYGWRERLGAWRRKKENNFISLYTSTFPLTKTQTSLFCPPPPSTIKQLASGRDENETDLYYRIQTRTPAFEAKLQARNSLLATELLGAR